MLDGDVHLGERDSANEAGLLCPAEHSAFSVNLKILEDDVLHLSE